MVQFDNKVELQNKITEMIVKLITKRVVITKVRIIRACVANLPFKLV